MNSKEYFKNLKGQPHNFYSCCLCNPKYLNWREDFEQAYLQAFGIKRAVSYWNALENPNIQKSLTKRYKKIGAVSKIKLNII